jgi:hypothetical protein
MAVCMIKNCCNPAKFVLNRPDKYFLACQDHAEKNSKLMIERNITFIFGEICVFCSGSRIVNNFKHIQNGFCFRCNGTGAGLVLGNYKKGGK